MIESLQRRPARLTVSLAILLTVALTLAGCESEDGGASSTVDASSQTETATPGAANTSTATSASVDEGNVSVEGEIIVFAASSLTDSFNELGNLFEEANPDATVTFNFASSSALATQINEGAPADVYASADLAQMQNVKDAGNAANDQVFATNMPVVVVPASGSPIERFEDLREAGLRLVLAGEEVPVGRYAREILANASGEGGISANFADDVLANLQSNEANVRAVLTKVQLGEADAGIVYSTDAATALDEARVIEIPDEFNVVAQYPIATVAESSNPEGAEAFVAFVLGSEGQAVLAEYGFGTP